MLKVSRIFFGLLLAAGINTFLLEGVKGAPEDGALEVKASEGMVAPFKLALRAPEDDTGTEEQTRRPRPAPKGVISEPGETESEPPPGKGEGTQRDFVPSEEIPADQAVDFPADI